MSPRQFIRPLFHPQKLSRNMLFKSIIPKTSLYSKKFKKKIRKNKKALAFLQGLDAIH